VFGCWYIMIWSKESENYCIIFANRLPHKRNLLNWSSNYKLRLRLHHLNVVGSGSSSNHPKLLEPRIALTWINGLLLFSKYMIGCGKLKVMKPRISTAFARKSTQCTQGFDIIFLQWLFQIFMKRVTMSLHTSSQNTKVSAHFCHFCEFANKKYQLCFPNPGVVQILHLLVDQFQIQF